MGFNWDIIKDLLLSVLQVVIISLTPMVVTALRNFLNAKMMQVVDASENENLDSLIIRLFEFADSVVAFVSQTYVDNLKKDGKFTVEEQKAAFDMAYERLLSMIDEESKELLAYSFGDIAEYLQTIIEAAVRRSKMEAIK